MCTSPESQKAQLLILIQASCYTDVHHVCTQSPVFQQARLYIMIQASCYTDIHQVPFVVRNEENTNPLGVYEPGVPAGTAPHCDQ